MGRSAPVNGVHGGVEMEFNIPKTLQHVDVLDRTPGSKLGYTSQKAKISQKNEHHIICTRQSPWMFAHVFGA